jgi:hypothetical protein
MSDHINLFVSYTRRDGEVTDELLERLHAHLAGVCNPFIHAIEERKVVLRQGGVLSALLCSHVLLLLESPETRRSPWVRLELGLSRLRLIPVIRINVAEIASWK